MAQIIKFKTINEDQKSVYGNGWHLPHPISPDLTLCGLAVSDNYDNLKTQGKKGLPTCQHCVEIVNYCKSII